VAGTGTELNALATQRHSEIGISTYLTWLTCRRGATSR
jgi:hypothetical protein